MDQGPHSGDPFGAIPPQTERTPPPRRTRSFRAVFLTVEGIVGATILVIGPGSGSTALAAAIVTMALVALPTAALAFALSSDDLHPALAVIIGAAAGWMIIFVAFIVVVVADFAV